jgi:hypothetical protein
MPLYCPTCGKPITDLVDYPDTKNHIAYVLVSVVMAPLGLDLTMMRCPRGHEWIVRQDMSTTLEQIQDYPSG